jgi:hypothetical protein
VPAADVSEGAYPRAGGWRPATRSCEDERRGDALRKFGLTGAWLMVSALPSLLLLMLGFRLIGRGDQTSLFLSWLWVLCGIATAPVYRKMLAAMPEVKALPPDERRLEHLPSACARMVREAETIRVHVDTLGLDAALQRAWELANEVDRADPAVRAEIERAGASLQAIHELVATRAEAPGDAKQQRTRLIAALTEFEQALDSPRARGFR